jgi:hypothetical protein
VNVVGSTEFFNVTHFPCCWSWCFRLSESPFVPRILIEKALFFPRFGGLFLHDRKVVRSLVGVSANSVIPNPPRTEP